MKLSTYHHSRVWTFDGGGTGDLANGVCTAVSGGQDDSHICKRRRAMLRIQVHALT
jgi:hypothetical protein